MIKPPWARDGDGDDEEEQATGKKVHAKPSSEHPEWQWVVMRQTWLIMTEWHRRTDYCKPDNFDMYIYNDFFGYGLQELQENLVSVSVLAVRHMSNARVTARQIQ